MAKRKSDAAVESLPNTNSTEKPAKRRFKNGGNVFRSREGKLAQARYLKGVEKLDDVDWLEEHLGAAASLAALSSTTVAHLNGKPVSQQKLDCVKESKDDFVPDIQSNDTWTDPDYLHAYLITLDGDLARRKQDPHHYAELPMLGGYPIRTSRYMKGLRTEIAAVKAQLEDLRESTAEIKGIARTMCRAVLLEVVHGPSDPQLCDPALRALPKRANFNPLVEEAVTEEGEIVESVEQASHIDGPSTSFGTSFEGMARAQTAIGNDFEEGEGDDEYDPLKDFTALLNDE